MSEKLVYSPKEVGKIIGIGMNGMYALCNREDFPAIRVGRKILIPVDGLKRWLAQQSGEVQKDHKHLDDERR